MFVRGVAAVDDLRRKLAEREEELAVRTAEHKRAAAQVRGNTPLAACTALDYIRLSYAMLCYVLSAPLFERSAW